MPNVVQSPHRSELSSRKLCPTERVQTTPSTAKTKDKMRHCSRRFSASGLFAGSSSVKKKTQANTVAPTARALTRVSRRYSLVLSGAAVPRRHHRQWPRAGPGSDARRRPGRARPSGLNSDTHQGTGLGRHVRQRRQLRDVLLEDEAEAPATFELPHGRCELPEPASPGAGEGHARSATPLSSASPTTGCAGIRRRSTLP